MLLARSKLKRQVDMRVCVRGWVGLGLGCVLVAIRRTLHGTVSWPWNAHKNARIIKLAARLGEGRF